MLPRMIVTGLPLLAMALATQAVGQAATPAAPATASPAAEPVAATAPAQSTVRPASGALAAAINQQGAAAGDKAATKRQLVRAQILLDRRHFSPGVIDGATGSNMRRAVEGFQQAENLPVNGTLDAATWERLVAGNPAPAIRGYVIAAEDVAGPFAAPVTPGTSRMTSSTSEG